MWKINLTNGMMKILDSKHVIMIHRIIRILFYTIICIPIVSCSKSTDSTDETIGEKKLTLNILGTGFEVADNINPLATNSLSTNRFRDSVLNRYFEYDSVNELDIVTELINNNKTNKQKLGSTNSIKTALAANSRYKFIVYDQDGRYIKEVDRIYTQESSEEPIILFPNRTYTFVVYSVQSSTELPTLSFTDVNNKTLTTSRVNGVSDYNKFVLFKAENFQTNLQRNELEVLLKPLYSRVTIEIDARTEGKITAAHGTINNLGNPNSNSVNLFTGTLADTESTSVPFSFTINENDSLRVASSQSINVIPNGQGSTITFAEWTIVSYANPIIETKNRTNYTPNFTLNIRPGYIYKLKITVNPDSIINRFRGQKAVRIGGKFWMQHNLGADTTLPANSGNYLNIGHYYPWGRPDDYNIIRPNNFEIEYSSTNGFPLGYQNAGSAFRNFIMTWWNIGCLTGCPNKPIKREKKTMYYNSNNTSNSTGGWDDIGPSNVGKIVTIGDPCPKGWRIPTKREYIHLKENTINGNLGVFAQDTIIDTNKTYAVKKFTSINNPNAVLFFIVTGRKAQETGKLTEMGTHGNYWTSELVTTGALRQATNMLFTGATAQSSVDPNTSNQLNYLMPVRCIADMRQYENGKLKPFNEENYSY